MPSPRRRREQAVLRRFIQVYCRCKHGTRGELCRDCAELLAYADERLARCPFDPKPACKHCEVHCYKPQFRARIREVMKFSGIHFVKRGRLDWLLRHFLT